MAGYMSRKRILDSQKDDILKMYNASRKTVRNIAEDVGVSKTSVYRVLHKYEKTGQVIYWRDKKRLIAKCLDDVVDPENNLFRGKVSMRSDPGLTIGKYIGSTYQQQIQIWQENIIDGKSSVDDPNSPLKGGGRIHIAEIEKYKEGLITAEVLVDSDQTFEAVAMNQDIYQNLASSADDNDEDGDKAETQEINVMGSREDSNSYKFSEDRSSEEENSDSVLRRVDEAIVVYESIFDKRDGLFGSLDFLKNGLNERQLIKAGYQIGVVVANHNPGLGASVTESYAEKKHSAVDIFTICIDRAYLEKTGKIQDFRTKRKIANEIENEKKRKEQLLKLECAIRDDTLARDLGKICKEWHSVAVDGEKRKQEEQLKQKTRIRNLKLAGFVGWLGLLAVCGAIALNAAKRYYSPASSSSEQVYVLNSGEIKRPKLKVDNSGPTKRELRLEELLKETYSALTDMQKENIAIVRGRDYLQDKADKLIESARKAKDRVDAMVKKTKEKEEIRRKERQWRDFFSGLGKKVSRAASYVKEKIKDGVVKERISGLVRENKNLGESLDNLRAGRKKLVLELEKARQAYLNRGYEMSKKNLKMKKQVDVLSGKIQEIQLKLDKKKQEEIGKQVGKNLESMEGKSRPTIAGDQLFENLQIKLEQKRKKAEDNMLKWEAVMLSIEKIKKEQFEIKEKTPSKSSDMDVSFSRDGVGYLDLDDVEENGITLERLDKLAKSGEGLVESLFNLDLENFGLHTGTILNHTAGTVIDAPIYLIQGKPGMITSAKASNNIQDFFNGR